MKKAIILAAICFICSRGSAQETESVVEEKSSAWIKVSAPAIVARPAKKTSAPARPTVVKQTKPITQTNTATKPPDAFIKTNKQVNRFKKG